MFPFCCTFILIFLFLYTSLISDCFLQNTYIIDPKYNVFTNKWSLFATKSKLKAVRKFSRDRPKKTRPSAIYPSPTIYYGNVHNHFGSPPEYLAIPVEKTLNILRNGQLSELISLMKKGITGTELAEVLSNKSFFNSLSQEVDSLKEIAEYEACDVTSDLHMYFNSILKSPTDYENYIDKFYTIKKLQSYWNNREQILYNVTFKQLFSRLKRIAYKLRDAGTSLEDFSDPKLWHKYGVFKIVPNCKMVENYLEKHKIALNFNIKSLYYRDVKTNEIKSNFHKFFSELGLKNDSTSGTPSLNRNIDAEADIIDSNAAQDNARNPDMNQDCYKLYPDQPEASETGFTLDEKGKLPKDLIDRIVDDLTGLGVLDANSPWSINLSKIDELQEAFTTEDSQHAYAIRDFYLSFKYPDYKIESDPYVLESYVNHQYRTKTYERDLLHKYKNWLLSGAPRDAFKPMNLKYQHLGIWHSLSKNQRRKLAQKYVQSMTVPVTQ